MNGRKIINWVIVLLVLTGALMVASQFSASFTFTSPVAPSSASSASEKKAVLVVVGDIMLDRNVRNKIGEIGFDAYFSGVKDLVSNADIAVANLEGPFTTSPSVTASLVSKELKFTFDPALAPKLASLGFDVLGLANNHTLNFGHQGLQTTRDYIRQADMQYYGDPENKTEISTIIEKNDIIFGFVGFHEFTYENFDKVMDEIDKVRPSVDVLVVTPHWGVEYQKEPTENMKTWAQHFIDHGADVVIGAHPHIVGDIAEYNGKKIFYSLGNFAFDQYFSEDTMKGLAIKITADKDKNGKMGLGYEVVPIRVDKTGVSVAESL